MQLTCEAVQNSEELRSYIVQADRTLASLGYTEHSFAHVTKSAYGASGILEQLGYEKRICELCWIAGFLHDIGNVVNRVGHAQSGALMAFRLLDKMGMEPGEIAEVVTAIGNHDEGTAVPVTPLAAALILADKSDVRRSRVRNRDSQTFDIHDRVNFSVEESDLILSVENRTITLNLTVDTEICSVMDYFEIFLTRMMLCKRAAHFLELTFKLSINGTVLL